MSSVAGQVPLNNWCKFVTIIDDLQEGSGIFCPRCGNAALQKVEVIVGPHGEEVCGVQKKHVLRGTRYSLPKPKVSWGFCPCMSLTGLRLTYNAHQTLHAYTMLLRAKHCAAALVFFQQGQVYSVPHDNLG